MKFAFTADLHLKRWPDTQYDEDGNPLKLMEILNCFEQICIYCCENKIDNIIIGGDLNDTKAMIYSGSFILFKNILEKYNNLNYFIISGNHDIIEKDRSEFCIDIFRNIPNVNIITEPLIIEDITFIPWANNITDLIKKSDSNKYLISHFGLNEAQMSSGLSLRTSITLNDLKKFEIVLLGHYHKPQNVGNVYYSGSLIPIRRDERNEIKRFLIVDGDTNDIVSIPTTGYRNYIEITLDSENDNYDEIKQEIEKYKKLGHFVIVKNTMKVIPVELKESVEDGVRIIDNFVEDSISRGITSNMGLESQMKRWAELEKIPENEIDEYIKIGLESLDIKEK